MCRKNVLKIRTRKPPIQSADLACPPVAFIIFNRLDTTTRVFDAIRMAKPSKLFLIADGARLTHQEDTLQCRLVRDYVCNAIDWPCQVMKNFSDVNLGCMNRVSSGITWLFKHVDKAIILEDDCLPDPSFFQYVSELLERYKDDTRIMMISGNNATSDKIKIKDSYYFTKYPRIWGWATWRRAWEMYDVDIKSLPEYRDKVFAGDYVDRRFWEACFDSVYAKSLDTWDYQWVFTIWKNGGGSICPATNLIKNIGFGQNATHTLDTSSVFADMETSPLSFPLVHPKKSVINREADQLERLQEFSLG